MNMCIAINILKEQMALVDVKKKELEKDLSTYDKKLSEFYHKVEGATFNASEGYNIAKSLQNILHERRSKKFEWSQLNNLSGIQQSNLDKMKTSEQRYLKEFNTKKVYLFA
jgi:hypothetical protein